MLSEEPQTKSISAIVGKIVTSVSRGDYLFDGIPNQDDLGPLEIEFQDGSSVLFSLVDDGESVSYRFFNALPEFLSNHTSRVLLSDSVPFHIAVGASITSVQDILFGVSGQIDRVLAGHVIHLNNSHYITYYNAGDFAKIYFDESPPDIGSDFVLEFVASSQRA